MRRVLKFRERRSLHIEARIHALGFALPPRPPLPKGSYMNFSAYGPLIYLSGHLPQRLDGSLVTGRLGENLDVTQGQHAAQLATLQMLASLQAACPDYDLDRVQRILRVTGFVNSALHFTEQARVMNGCSDLLGEIFGLEKGRHARSAIGVNVLPLEVPVELEAIVLVDLPSGSV